MNVDKELLEKYHADTCTPEERKLVDDWLLDDDVADFSEIDFAGNKEALKNEIWADIIADIPEAKVVKLKSNSYFMWKGAVAASLVFAILGGLIFWIIKQRSGEVPQLLSFVNTSAHSVKHIDAKSYTATLGPNTIAKFGKEDGAVDLTGSILISPKQNITIERGEGQSTILKKGETYIILKNTDGKDGIIVISERNLMDMPPVMQQQINSQFQI